MAAQRIVILRSAQPSDVPALARVAAAAYQQAFAGILEPPTLALRDASFFEAHFAPRVQCMHLAEQDGQVLGYSLVTQGHLDQLFIAPQAQGKGVGASLLAQVEAAGTHTLECFRDNPRARAFYEAKGWRLARAYEREFAGKARAFVFYEKPLAGAGTASSSKQYETAANDARSSTAGTNIAKAAPSKMHEEALSCGACAARFLALGLPSALSAAQTLRARGLCHLEVLGRGSSGHAGAMLRYAFARAGGLTVSSAMPSAAADDRALAHLAGSALLVISQSGQSPDLLRYAQAARRAGAYTLAFINAEGSPLQDCVDLRVPLCAGIEASVAATKSVLMSLLAGLAVLACYREDAPLLAALQDLPHRLDQAAACDWSALGAALSGARAAYFIGRGADLGIAKELALKAAEVLGVPSLAYSSAEFLHGPLGAVSNQTPVIGMVSDAADLPSLLIALERARALGAPTLLAHGLAVSAPTPATQLPLPPRQDQQGATRTTSASTDISAEIGRSDSSSLADALLFLPPAYLAMEAAARALGRDPDRPAGLAKVTRTI